MRRLPLIICGSAIAGVAGWYSGETAMPEPESPGVRSAAAMAVVPAPRLAVSALSATEVKSRLDAALFSTALDSTELQLLMARWVAVDLEGAKAWMHARYDDDDLARETGRQPLTCFFKAWGALDPAAAMEEALVSKFERGETARRAVVASLARADVATMTAVLQKLKPGTPDFSDRIGVGDLVHQLAVRDPAAARALALQLKGGLASAAVLGVAEVWARTDPQAALEWVEQNGHFDPRHRASEAILTEWARRDPAAAGPFLLKKTPGQPDRFSVGAAAEAVARIGASNPADAVAFVGKFIPPDQLKTGLGQVVGRILVQNGADPQSTPLLCQLVAMLPPESLTAASPSLFSDWPSNEVLQTTWDRLLTEPGGAARTFLMGQIGEKLAYGNPGPFLAAIMQWPDEGLRDEVLKRALSSQTTFAIHGNEDWRASIESLAAVVETLPDAVRPLGALKLAWSTAATDPRAAAAAIARYPAIAETENLALTLGNQFVYHADPAAAQAWAATLPTEKSQASAWEGIASAWYEQDSEAASQWVDSLEPGAHRDGAAASLALQAVHDDPEAAFAWAASVLDAARRAESTKKVVQRWAFADWRAASTALEQSTLPAEQKAALYGLIFQHR